MDSKVPNNSVSRTTLWLMVSLMVVSTGLFVVGITLERRSEATETPETNLEAKGELAETPSAPVGEGTESGGEEQHRESAQSAEARPESTIVSPVRPEDAPAETVLGINIENPLFVIGAVVAWGVLIVGLLRFGYLALIPIIVVAVGAGLFDIAEIVTQISRSNIGLALLAALVAAAHIAVAVMGGLLHQRRSVPQPQ
jgi:hypothetical protein